MITPWLARPAWTHTCCYCALVTHREFFHCWAPDNLLPLHWPQCLHLSSSAGARLGDSHALSPGLEACTPLAWSHLWLCLAAVAWAKGMRCILPWGGRGQRCHPAMAACGTTSLPELLSSSGITQVWYPVPAGWQEVGDGLQDNNAGCCRPLSWDAKDWASQHCWLSLTCCIPWVLPVLCQGRTPVLWGADRPWHVSSCRTL